MHACRGDVWPYWPLLVLPVSVPPTVSFGATSAHSPVDEVSPPRVKGVAPDQQTCAHVACVGQRRLVLCTCDA